MPQERRTVPRAVLEHALFLTIAVALVGVPIVAHLASPAAAIALCAAGSVVAAVYVRAAIPALLIVAFQFQNLFVSLVSPWLADTPAFNAARGYNFIITASVWLWIIGGYCLAPRARSRQLDALLWPSVLALGVIGLYFGLGLARDPYAAVVYLRNAVTPFLVFQLTLVIAADGPGDRLRFLRAPVYLLLAYGLAEFLARDALFDLIQANSYMTFSLADIARSGEWIETMRKTGRVLRDLQDTQIVSFLNTDLFGFSAIRMYRMLGPNFHAISFGYGLLLAAFLLLRWRQPVLFCLAVGLLVLVGAKGALICLALCCAALLLDRVRPAATLPVFLAVLGLYASAVIVTGRASGDYHVLGLFGGLHAFLGAPWGAGLGAGGNLAGDATRIDWEKAQAIGRTDWPVESAFGVLLYQVGPGVLVLCAVPLCAALAAWRLSRAVPGRDRMRSLRLFALGTLAVTLNGLFQEEALFAPLALGGMMIALADRLGDGLSRVSSGADVRTAGAPEPSAQGSPA
ncbi:hypothetical protein GCM10007886_01000 [Methylobacterium gregans]|nr:hypothetical protein GCM10007886_01000 [Methylobacterium gregans]